MTFHAISFYRHPRGPAQQDLSAGIRMSANYVRWLCGYPLFKRGLRHAAGMTKRNTGGNR